MTRIKAGSTKGLAAAIVPLHPSPVHGIEPLDFCMACQTYLLSTGVKEITQSDNVTMIELSHDLKLSILKERTNLKSNFPKGCTLYNFMYKSTNAFILVESQAVITKYVLLDFY